MTRSVTFACFLPNFGRLFPIGVLGFLLVGCAVTSEEDIRCDNHYGMIVLCKDPRFADDIQCTNPCG